MKKPKVEQSASWFNCYATRQRASNSHL